MYIGDGVKLCMVVFPVSMLGDDYGEGRLV